MPWCPVCKNEYKEGYTTCADCKVELVESLEEMPVAIYFGEEKELQRMVDFLKVNSLENVYLSYDEKEKQHEISVKKEEVEQAKKLLVFYLQEQQKEAMKHYAEEENFFEEEGMENIESSDWEEQSDSDTDRETKDKSKQAKNMPRSYEDKHQKAEEYKSSAFALIFVGVLVVVLMIINELGVLPVQINFSNKILVYGVMGIMCVVFLGIGVYSIMQSKKIAAMAVKDDDEINKLKEFLHTTITKDKLESECGDSEESDEQLYFIRTEYMKKALAVDFASTEPTLVEKIVDEYYEELFS